MTGVEATKLQTGIEDTPPQTWQQSYSSKAGEGVNFWVDFWTLNDTAETYKKYEKETLYSIVPFLGMIFVPFRSLEKWRWIFVLGHSGLPSSHGSHG